METGLDREKLLHYKAVALKHLSDPTKLRLLVISGLTFLSLVGIYAPLSDQIDRTKAKAAEQKRRLEAIKDTESLRREVQGFRERILKNADTNDWVQYILGGLREVRLKLRDMTSRPPQNVGPYRTVNLSIEVEGTYVQIKQFMEWLEQSDRLLRVDSTQLVKQTETLVMKVIVLGLVHRDAKPA